MIGFNHTEGKHTHIQSPLYYITGPDGSHCVVLCEAHGLLNPQSNYIIDELGISRVRKTCSETHPTGKIPTH